MTRRAHDALIAMGSNLGDREGFLWRALDALEARGARVLATSGLYETEPVGGPAQGPYLNACACVGWSGGARALLELLLEVERSLGRVRSVPDAPRTIDLDLLLLGDQVIREEGLEVPHPRMAARAFVLVPAMEIAGGRIHPVEGRTLGALGAEVSGRSGVRLWKRAPWWPGAGATGSEIAGA